MDKAKREQLRERFLRDPLPLRLGGLAATLGRISSSIRKSTDPNRGRVRGRSFTMFAAGLGRLEGLKAGKLVEKQ